MIACVAVFVAQNLFPFVTPLFALVPERFFRGWIWQIFTFHFLHGGVTHLLMNMLMLWMFGGELELKFGRNKFLTLAAISGIGAGLCQALVTSEPGVPVIGASGIVFGLLLAWGLTWPDRTVLVMFIIPMKGKWMALMAGVIEFLYVVGGQNPGVAHLAHLGGMLFAYLFLRYDKLYMRARKGYYERKLRQFRKKYKVYEGGKSDSDKPPTYH
jgi:membrane associated rhomboid family serine protease